MDLGVNMLAHSALSLRGHNLLWNAEEVEGALTNRIS